MLRDPGLGAAEPELAGLDHLAGRGAPVTARSVFTVLSVPAFSLLMVSRLMSGHLVQEYGFTNSAAALILLTYGLGYSVGAAAGD